jgi:hypothetical protein
MRTHFITAMVSILIGCAAGAVLVRDSHAQAYPNDPSRGFPVNPSATHWHQYCLSIEPGDPARAYMADRGGEGWELIAGSVGNSSGAWLLCFRRSAQ